MVKKHKHEWKKKFVVFTYTIDKQIQTDTMACACGKEYSKKYEKEKHGVDYGFEPTQEI